MAISAVAKCVDLSVVVLRCLKSNSTDLQQLDLSPLLVQGAAEFHELVDAGLADESYAKRAKLNPGSLY